MAQHGIPEGLRTALDGYAVGKGFGNDCPSCGQEYEAGDQLVVTAERRRMGGRWVVAGVICSACGVESLADVNVDETDTIAERALVTAALAAAPMTLVLDGESVTVLDRTSSKSH